MPLRRKATRTSPPTFKDILVGGDFEYPIIPIHARRTYKKMSQGNPLALGTAMTPVSNEAISFEDDTEVIVVPR